MMGRYARTVEKLGEVRSMVPGIDPSLSLRMTKIRLVGCVRDSSG